MEECIFCKIASKKIKCEIVYESDNFVAFPDANPRSKGHTLVVPKKHYTNLIEMPAVLGNELIDVIKKVAEIRISAKYDTVNPVDDIKDLKVPVLIIHGDKDENIPVENANMLYESAKEPKKLLIFPGATHVESHSIAQVKYEKEVLGFFKKYLKEK